MSTTDDEVHTPTLRWLADRHQRTAERHQKEMAKAKRDGDGWRYRGELGLWQAAICECRSLRSLARRIDNKRLKGGDS